MFRLGSLVRSLSLSLAPLASSQRAGVHIGASLEPVLLNNIADNPGALHTVLSLSDEHTTEHRAFILQFCTRLIGLDVVVPLVVVRLVAGVIKVRRLVGQPVERSELDLKADKHHYPEGFRSADLRPSSYFKLIL